MKINKFVACAAFQWFSTYLCFRHFCASLMALQHCCWWSKRKFASAIMVDWCFCCYHFKSECDESEGKRKRFKNGTVFSLLSSTWMRGCSMFSLFFLSPLTWRFKQIESMEVLVSWRVSSTASYIKLSWMLSNYGEFILTNWHFTINDDDGEAFCWFLFWCWSKFIFSDDQ